MVSASGPAAQPGCQRPGLGGFSHFAKSSGCYRARARAREANLSNSGGYFHLVEGVRLPHDFWTTISQYRFGAIDHGF
jgi:hypothetical protein